MFAATNLDLVEQGKYITEYLSNKTNKIIEKQGIEIQQANNLFMVMIILLVVMTLLLLSNTILVAYCLQKSKMPEQVKIFNHFFQLASSTPPECI